MKGLKMRTPPDATLVDIMQALGAEAQQIKFAELYVALQQGVVDGQEEPAGEHPRQQAVRSAEAPRADQPPVPDDAAAGRQATWDKLTPADRQALTAAATEATSLQRKLSQEADDKLLAELKTKGVR
jgi:TRAP-type C4-dicarboxylate transport system substrate-binding protein